MWSESCRIFNVWEALNENPRVVDEGEGKRNKVGFFARIRKLFANRGE